MTRKPVYLATAHLNHVAVVAADVLALDRLLGHFAGQRLDDPTFSGPRWRNLAALCQRCHMIYDPPEHRRRHGWNAFRVRAIGNLFSGLYS